jgi:hypothetical protein
MPIIREKFTPLIGIDPITKRVEVVYHAKVTIFIKLQGNLYPYKLLAYVDSGATRNLFPAEILEALNIKLENGRKKKHVGIGGIELTSYIHEAEILISGYNIKTEIDFCKDHKPLLLGMEMFFSFFDSVNFNMEINQVELSYSKKVN